MNALTTRILKEVRPLLWPWCAGALPGALLLVYRLDRTQLIWLIGLLVVPLLATLPLGNEFQHRTLSLLLSQPIGRMKIWCEKLSVTVVAVVSAVLVFSLALRATSFRPDGKDWAFAGAWILASVASATFWTLIARSTVGGFVYHGCPMLRHELGLLAPRGRTVLANRRVCPDGHPRFAGLCRRNALAGRTSAGTISVNRRHGRP